MNIEKKIIIVGAGGFGREVVWTIQDCNKISKNKLELSRIFDWFFNDFTKNGTLINYLNKYASIKVSEKASIKYLTYDWILNNK